MANTIKIKRGLSSNISNITLAQGELAITTDTNELYAGTANGNVKLNDSNIDEIGCPTCGMDIVYTNEIIFEFKNIKPVKMERTQYDDWSGDCGLISIGQMIKIFINYKEEMEKLKETELVPFIADILIKEAKEKDISISIEIDGEEYE